MKGNWIVGLGVTLALVTVAGLMGSRAGAANLDSSFIRVVDSVDMTPEPVAIEAIKEADAPVGAKRLLISYDDGQMEDRMAITASGMTVEFNAPEERIVPAIQFFGSRYGAKVSPGDHFTVYVSDASFKPISRADKPLMNLSPGRETWQTVAIVPPAKVVGKFYVTLVYNSTIEKGIYIGVDTSIARGFSKVGLPGTVASDVESPLNWMIRASTQRPGQYDAVKAKIAKPIAAKPVAPKPSPVVISTPKIKVGSTGTTRPGQSSSAVRKPAAKQPMVKSNTGGAQVAYRAPNRRLIIGPRIPKIPRGSGRVDVTWSVQPPITVELNYVGKPAKIIEGLDVKRFVVDFPVPEPGLFNIVVNKAGFQPASKQFRVVAGGRQEWQVNLSAGGAPVLGVNELPKPVPLDADRVTPMIDDNSLPAPDALNSPPKTGVALPPIDGNISTPKVNLPSSVTTVRDQAGVHGNPPERVAPTNPPALTSPGTRPSRVRPGIRRDTAPLPPRPDLEEFPEPPPSPSE